MMNSEAINDQDVPDPAEEPIDTVQDDPSGTEDAGDRSSGEAEAGELMERLMRLQAEYENYRKRVAREKAGWTAQALERFVLDLLPVVDSFDRALGAENSAGLEGLLDGMRLVKRQLVGALGMHGVEAIDALGAEFDPNVHEAFMSRPAETGEETGTIVEELVTGYRMGDRTVRPTRGIVASEPEQDGDSQSGPEEE